MSQFKNTLSGILLMTLLLSVNSLIASGKKTVLFDEHHGQLFKTEKTGELQLSGLAAIFKKEKWTVKTCNSEITDELLKEVDALVITGAFKPVTQTEIEAIVRFIKKGGSLSIMLHIGPPFANLLHALNVSISNSVIHEITNVIKNKDLDFNATNLIKHPLTNKLEHISVFGGWALMSTGVNAKVIALTSSHAWIDLNGNGKADAQQAFGVVVAGTMGSGQFVVFGDDAIFQNHFLQEYNYSLGENLAKWLKK